MASDTEKQLQEFLLKKPFNYQVIANQHAFMNQTLKVLTFPTHFIVDKNGTIIKVVNTAEELEHELQVFLNN